MSNIGLFIRQDWAEARRRLFAKPRRGRIVSLLIFGLIAVCAACWREQIRSAKIEADERAQAERSKQVYRAGVEQAARDLSLNLDSKQANASFPSVVIFGVSERGKPQFDYSGPDSLSYRYAGDSFTFQLKPVIGTPWATAKAEMTVGTNNDVSITIQSTSDRAYDIQFLGLSTNSNSDVEENKIKQTIHVPAGDQKLTIDRFIIYTYDFAKDREREAQTPSR